MNVTDFIWKTWRYHNYLPKFTSAAPCLNMLNMNTMYLWWQQDEINRILKSWSIFKMNRNFMVKSIIIWALTAGGVIYLNCLPNRRVNPPPRYYTVAWLSRQSEILCTGCTSENKWELSHGWKETCGCYEMIQAVSVLSQSQLAARRDLVSHRSSSKWLDTPLGHHLTEQPTVGLQLSTATRLRSRRAKWKSRRAEDLRVLQCGMIKRRIYGSVWQSVFVSLHLCLSPSVSLIP